MKRRWLTWAGVGLVIACIAFFTQQVGQLLSKGGLDLSRSWHLLPPALCAYSAAYIAFAVGWHQLMVAAGSRIPLATDVGIFTTSQFAKYLPGNVGHHAGRVALAVKYGHPGYSVVATMIVELAIIVAFMVLLSLPYFGYWASRMDLRSEQLLYVAMGGLAIAAISAGIVYKFRHYRRLSNLLDSIVHWKAQGWHSVARMATASSLMLIGILLTAYSLGLLDNKSVLSSIDNFLVVLAVFAVSWIFGMIIPGAPAGVGVREVILTEGLTPLIGRDQSISIALLFRVLSTTADIVMFLFGGMLLWATKKPRRG